ncbi:MAG: Sec-independent protein translocase protein TatB [Methylobacter sp.]
MFDVGFSELCLIGLVSLLVIGPERLPRVARLAGFWLGKTRSMVASVKEEIKLELQAEEMRQLFKEQSGLQEAQQMLDEASNTFKAAIDPLPAASEAPHDLSLDAKPQEPSPLDKSVPHESK